MVVLLSLVSRRGCGGVAGGGSRILGFSSVDLVFSFQGHRPISSQRRGGVTVMLLGLASVQVPSIAVMIGGIWDLGSSAMSSKPYPSLFSLESSGESHYLGGAIRVIVCRR